MDVEARMPAHRPGPSHMTPTPLERAIGRGDFKRVSAATSLVYSLLLVTLASGPKRHTAAQLAASLQIGRRTVERSLQRLITLGWIDARSMRAEHRHRFDAVYQLRHFDEDGSRLVAGHTTGATVARSPRAPVGVCPCPTRKPGPAKSRGGGPF